MHPWAKNGSGERVGTSLGNSYYNSVRYGNGFCWFEFNGNYLRQDLDLTLPENRAYWKKVNCLS